jgi:hypothetical protein
MIAHNLAYVVLGAHDVDLASANSNCSMKFDNSSIIRNFYRIM